MLTSLLLAASLTLSNAVQDALSGKEGVYVQIDCATGEVFQSDEKLAEEKVAPCSTFKIWNSAIGLETGVITDPDALFWKWDRQKRDMVAAWNQDQTLRTAFATSCVPAYQELARKIGAERMQEWIDKLGYGDRNTSSGLDVFWLPAPGRGAIVISAVEQAEKIADLVNGKLPLSEKTRAVLKDIMKVKSTDKGTLYGKTGTGGNGTGKFLLGWFVGYVESGGKTYSFACRLVGDGVMGKDARAVVETVLEKEGLL